MELRKYQAVIEFVWLMFFLKDWKRLAAAIRETAPRHRFPGHMADLYFLAAYRTPSSGAVLRLPAKFPWRARDCTRADHPLLAGTGAHSSPRGRQSHVAESCARHDRLASRNQGANRKRATLLSVDQTYYERYAASFLPSTRRQIRIAVFISIASALIRARSTASWISTRRSDLPSAGRTSAALARGIGKGITPVRA